MDITRFRIQDFLPFRNFPESRRLSIKSNPGTSEFPRFFFSKHSPFSGDQIDCRTFFFPGHQVQRNGRELHLSSAMHEKHDMARTQPGQSAENAFGFFQNLQKRWGAVTDFDDGGSMTLVIEHFLLHFFHHFGGQHRRAGTKIIYPLAH